MPLYEYECLGCIKKFDYLMRNSNEEINCPYCHKNNKLRKLVSGFAFSSRDSSGSMTASSGCGGCRSHNCSSCS